jgi:hypothetical protein
VCRVLALGMVGFIGPWQPAGYLKFAWRWGVGLPSSGERKWRLDVALCVVTPRTVRFMHPPISPLLMRNTARGMLPPCTLPPHVRFVLFVVVLSAPRFSEAVHFVSFRGGLLEYSGTQKPPASILLKVDFEYSGSQKPRALFLLKVDCSKTLAPRSRALHVFLRSSTARILWLSEAVRFMSFGGRLLEYSGSQKPCASCLLGLWFSGAVRFTSFGGRLLEYSGSQEPCTSCLLAARELWTLALRRLALRVFWRSTAREY